MPRPIHFEIPADDTDRAIRFYRDVFGWKIDKWDGPMPYWMITTGGDGEPGINGGLLPRPAPASGPGAGTNAAVLTMGVEDFDTTAATIEAAGGTVALPKTALTGMAWQGYFLDTEGNVFGIHQPDTSAA